MLEITKSSETKPELKLMRFSIIFISHQMVYVTMLRNILILLLQKPQLCFRAIIAQITALI